ncbi:MAG: glyceraldehyde-3-phosphate dehydrogenase [Candidatus Eisenbacteria bacterium]|nr:glyceraldehyde-3-phosphate dehydrogenase [Candidatus Eisenbacteria bacterium]
MRVEGPKILGINSLGRIGKLTLWHHAGRRYFDKIVVNQGRDVGKDLEAFCQTIEKDSTYGRVHHFLNGCSAEPCVRIEDREKDLLTVNGVPVQVLRRERNPKEIPWREHGARIVVDCTGQFSDPTRPEEHGKGSLRGHLVGGAEKVMNSADFKPKERGTKMPEDAVVLIFGVNHEEYDPARHNLVSAASCTTTALAHMMKTVIDAFSIDTILTASMSTIHAATNTQSVLDNVPKTGAKDLRKSRSILNNIILTSTNAAAALEKVIPVIREIGFMADSVRIPTSTASLIILNLTFRSRLDENGEPELNRAKLLDLYEKAAERQQKGLLKVSHEQNVSTDMIGENAAVVIEGFETHTRTGFVFIDLEGLPGMTPELLARFPEKVVRQPVTHAKIFGWYDNEYGSYTNRLGDLTVYVADRMD